MRILTLYLLYWLTKPKWSEFRKKKTVLIFIDSIKSIKNAWKPKHSRSDGSKNKSRSLSITFNMQKKQLFSCCCRKKHLVSFSIYCLKEKKKCRNFKQDSFFVPLFNSPVMALKMNKILNFWLTTKKKVFQWQKETSMEWNHRIEAMLLHPP